MTPAKACFSSHLKRQMGISDNTGKYIPHYQANIYKEEWTYWRVLKRSLLDSILYCGLTSYVLGMVTCGSEDVEYFWLVSSPTKGERILKAALNWSHEAYELFWLSSGPKSS